jgi:Bacterial regulatory helix-turn-helix protein, lysR family
MAVARLKEIAVIRIYVIHFCMTTSEPGWELFRTFLEVVRDGSLSGAARKLALTQPTRRPAYRCA